MKYCVPVYCMCESMYVCVCVYSLGLCGGDDMGINLGSMKDRKEEEEDEEVFLPVGLLTAWWWITIRKTVIPHNFLLGGFGSYGFWLQTQYHKSFSYQFCNPLLSSANAFLVLNMDEDIWNGWLVSTCMWNEDQYYYRTIKADHITTVTCATTALWWTNVTNAIRKTHFDMENAFQCS